MCHIRRAIAADSERAFGLVADFATSFRPEPGPFRRSFARPIAGDDALLLVADGPGGLHGYLLGFDRDTPFANGPVSWVEEVAVRADRRRQGIGRQLVRGFERRALSRGSGAVALATRRA